jgi:hypothetical protein
MTDTVDPPPTLARTAAESRQTRPRAPSADGFTGRDIFRHDWAHLTDREQVAAGLSLFVELDHLVVVEPIRGPRGGRPVWLLHGRELIALTEETADIGWPGGSVTVYRKNNKPAFGLVGDFGRVNG